MSDMLIRAEVELPTSAASLHFEVELADGSVTLLRPGQAWERQDYYNGLVKVRAVLSGSTHVSPVLFPLVLAIAGKVRASGTYVTRAFDMGSGIDLIAWLKTYIPTGASITVEADASDDSWQAVAQASQTPLQELGWISGDAEHVPGRAACAGTAHQLSIADRIVDRILRPIQFGIGRAPTDNVIARLCAAMWMLCPLALVFLHRRVCPAPLDDAGLPTLAAYADASAVEGFGVVFR